MVHRQYDSSTQSSYPKPLIDLNFFTKCQRRQMRVRHLDTTGTLTLNSKALIGVSFTAKCQNNETLNPNFLKTSKLMIC